MTIAAWPSAQHHVPLPAESSNAQANSPGGVGEVKSQSRLTRITPEFADISLSSAIEQAFDVVHGTILGQEEVDSLQVPYRRVHLSVESSVRGRATDSITIVVPGTTGSRERVLVQGTPWFDDGEEVVLFLSSRKAERNFGILGLSNGVLRVSSAQNGDRVAVGRLATGQSIETFLFECAQVAQFR
ncbi:MAG: hypothetical protein JNK02_04620 [Planctomycetes bacterium]|nr:hypothetical protein [Planctomycetota bacterium]